MLILATIILLLSGALLLALFLQNIFLTNLVGIGLVLLLAAVILLLTFYVVISLIFKKIKNSTKFLLLGSVFLVMALLLFRFTIYKRDLIDRSIPSKDVKNIKKLAAGLTKHTGMTIKYYDECQPNLPTPIPLPQGSIEIGRVNPSYKCQPGDVLLILSSGGGDNSNYFLLRKIDSMWKVIENLGSSLRF